MKVFVIGGGASGLTSAIKTRECGLDVTILEKKSTCGKKILMSGNGRCNYWNKDQDLSHYHSTNIEDFKVIYEKKKNEVEPFFKSLGIISTEIKGYMYPFSKEASCILNALLTKATKLGVKIINETNVEEIIKEKDYFKIKTNNKIFIADKVIISTGTNASLKEETNSYELAKSFNHKIIKPLPSLVQLIGKDHFYSEWEGVRTEVFLTLKLENKEVKKEHGEIQLTNYGISGICTFNLSGIIARKLNEKKEVLLTINFVPWFKEGKEEFIKYLDELAYQNKNYTLKELLEGFLNHKLVKLFLKLSHIKEYTNWQEIDKESFTSLLMEFPFKIKETKSTEYAQVLSGGIPLNEINCETMESKKVKGLYFTGELLDVDGECGGYNLGFA